MKQFILIFAVMLSLGLKAQLYVQPSGPSSNISSYVFVNDTFIYVDQDVNLEINALNNPLAESSIILRNEAQLLQGNGSDQLNKGTGDLSIFQEGTVNAWDYNFWASPVGLSFNGSGSSASDGNSVFSMRPINGGFTDTNQVIFQPISVTGSNPALLAGGYDGTVGPTAPLSIPTFWLWSFQSGAGYADWVHIDDTGTLDAGYGFSMKGINGIDPLDPGEGTPNNNNDTGNVASLTDNIGQRYDFRGRPNNGDILVPVGQDNFSLIGNPYPSALDLNYFLLENSNSGTFTATDINGNSTSVTGNDVTTGTAYFWDSNPNVMSHNLENYEGGYGTYSPDMGLNNNGTYVNATFYMYDETGAQIPGGTGDVGTFPTNGRRFSPVGQGFMVIGSNNGNVIFRNNHRVFAQEDNGSSVFKNNSNNNTSNDIVGVSTYYPDATFPESSKTIPKIKISIGINDTYSRELGITLLNKATYGYDVAGDARLSGLPTDVSFAIEGEKGYVINATPPNEYQFIPLTIDAETLSEFRFLAHYIENFDYAGVYLFDKVTQTYYDILGESALLQIKAGEHSKRFFIVFTKEQKKQTQAENTPKVKDISLENGVLESITVHQDNAKGQLEIHNPMNTGLDAMSLFDISGKLVLTKDQLGVRSIYNFTTSQLSSGIYIVQFNTTEGLTKAQKISVAN